LNVIARVSVPLVQIKKINRLIWLYSILIFIMALIITVIVSLRIAGLVIRPLNDIISVSKEITNGNYSRRIKLKSKDELGQLAVHFNKMASKLERTISDLNTKKIELAVDGNNKVILINPAAFTVFNLDADAEILGDDIENHIKNSQINSLLKDAIQKKQLTAGCFW